MLYSKINMETKHSAFVALRKSHFRPHWKHYSALHLIWFGFCPGLREVAWGVHRCGSGRSVSKHRLQMLTVKDCGICVCIICILTVWVSCQHRINTDGWQVRAVAGSLPHAEPPETIQMSSAFTCVSTIVYWKPFNKIWDLIQFHVSHLLITQSPITH